MCGLWEFWVEIVEGMVVVGYDNVTVCVDRVEKNRVKIINKPAIFSTCLKVKHCLKMKHCLHSGEHFHCRSKKSV